MTAGGLGISVIPALAVPSHSKMAKSLAFAKFKNKKNGRTMAMYFRKSYPFIENIKLLSAFIRTHLPSCVQKVKVA